MPTVRPGRYQRPGVFVEEFDRSLFESPTVQGVQSFVLGVSRKGPVNTPITLNSQNDLRDVFGNLDRNLEGKQSYFHRTISKLLESAPVVAINLFNPDDNLDTLDFKSMSAAVKHKNGIKQEAPYRRFFDTSSFWKRDTESFLSIARDVVGDENRVLHFTNMGERQITVFVVKSSVNGFDTTLLNWYGSMDDVPEYVSPKDFASDYMVDVVVLSGDWTNYSELAIDSRYSEYFNTNGLIKGQLFNMVNDPSVNVLRVWEGLSLIPFFRNQRNNNVFIETVINRDTDRTGLFCSFDAEAIEQDFRTGLVDLIGNSIVDPIADEIMDINFLSYRDEITEITNYEEVELDRVGNSFMLPTDENLLDSDNDRTMLFGEGYVEGFTINATGASASVMVTVTSANAYGIIGSELVEVEDDTNEFVYTNSDIPTTLINNEEFHKAIVLRADGTLTDNPTQTELIEAIVLGYVKFTVDSGEIIDSEFINISIDGSGGFNVFSDTDDLTYDISNPGEVYIEFINLSGNIPPTEYRRYRVLKHFNVVTSALQTPTATMLVSANGTDKSSLSNFEIEVNTIGARSITIRGKSADLQFIMDNGLAVYLVDDEFIINTGNPIESLKTKDTFPSSGNEGLVARYSQYYLDFFNGQINSMDYFHENTISDSTANLEFSGNTITSDKTLNLNTNDQIVIPQSNLNTGVYTIASINGFVYTVAENVNDENIKVTKIWDANDKNYVANYLDGDILNVWLKSGRDDFDTPVVDSNKSTTNIEFDIFSKISNFKQTVEIENDPEWTPAPNKILINTARYPEVRRGDFLLAKFDNESDGVPRKLTRITARRSFNSELTEITTDTEIRKIDIGGDLQTFRFTQIDDFVTTYKGVNFSGFSKREESLPNGTNQRQEEIMGIINRGTPLYNAITDKERFEFRYLVDSFGLGLTEQSKRQLVDITGKRKDSFGFINMPSMQDFRRSQSPTFIDNEGRLRTEFIRQGGDPESSPAFLYSLAEGDGATTVGYFTPWVTVSDAGRPKNVPPAAWIATTFLRKHNDSIPSVTPWTIAAGVTNGRITGIAGLEYDFISEDIINLNQMSVNPIVNKKNRGFAIETENTGQVLIDSSLSFIHVREVLIELERALVDMLMNFQWSYNTPETRAEIKLRADAICEDFVNRNGLFNFFNKCDGENNTPDLIDQQIGVLNTYVEPIQGMAVIVNNVTILRTGQIDSGGFL